jgi:long-chain acyl-CoA synthetase
LEVAAIPAVEASTGSKTMADLALLAARKHAGRTALKYKKGDEWIDISFEEFGDTVRETALGLMSLGLEKGDRIAILSNTRPEWAFACFAILSAGGVSVSIYQTNSPSEVQYVADHSESKAIFVEDQEQLAKVRTCSCRTSSTSSSSSRATTQLTTPSPWTTYARRAARATPRNSTSGSRR